MKKNILLLTGDIQTGKTSALKNIFKGRSDCRGFITPDSAQGRLVEFLPLGSRETTLMEANASDSTTLTIGRYQFYLSAFEQMKIELRSIKENPFQFNVIDELGKLELKGEGLSPELDEVIAHWKTDPDKKEKLLIVVREELIEKALQTFDLQGFPILYKTELNQLFE